jgi:membrane protease YdiL (CAAX protease family)
MFVLKRPAIAVGILLCHLCLAGPAATAGFSLGADGSDTAPARHVHSEVRQLIAQRSKFGDDIDFIVGAGLNAAYPGVGYIVQGERLKGIGFTVLSGALLGGAIWANSREDREGLRNNLLIVYQNLGFLTAWDVYKSEIVRRDEAFAQETANWPGMAGYLLSPFTPRAVLCWETLLPVSIASGLSYYTVEEADPVDRKGYEDYWPVSPLIAAQSNLIGAGEELVARGVILTEVAARTGSELTGLLVQAGLFGLGHASEDLEPEENVIRVAFATLFGCYTGWVTLNRPNGLKKSIAMHAWWDALVFSADYLEDGSAEPIVVTIGFRF